MIGLMENICLLGGGGTREEEGFEKLGPPAKCSERLLLNKKRS